jgi:hypothetical protein
MKATSENRYARGRRGLRGATATLAVVAAVAAAAGCGGSSKPTQSTTTAAAAISRAEFVARANAICSQADPGLAVAQGALARHPSPAQVAALVGGTIIPSVESQMSQIRALGTPTGDQATIARMLTLVHADLRKVRRHPALIATDVFGDFAKVAHPYGLKACAPLS